MITACVAGALTTRLRRMSPLGGSASAERQLDRVEPRVIGGRVQLDERLGHRHRDLRGGGEAALDREAHARFVDRSGLDLNRVIERVPRSRMPLSTPRHRRNASEQKQAFHSPPPG
jgi:hypothetical protein